MIAWNILGLVGGLGGLWFCLRCPQLVFESGEGPVFRTVLTAACLLAIVDAASSLFS